MVGEEMMKDQIDRNYGRLGGWLLARLYDGKLVYADWSAH